MFFRKKKKNAPNSAESERERDTHRGRRARDASDKAGVRLSTGEWTQRGRSVWRTFPGPATSEEALRVAVDRQPFADAIAHMKESLRAEVCGVLAGERCEDDRGPYVHVRAAIRGAEAREGATHVTFTQETWNAVHVALEQDHPKLEIVGWYHSHPGFGVSFSDMDRFVHQNFFPGPQMLALVMDPLSGDLAACHNTPEGVGDLGRIWVDGREHLCRLPAGRSASHGAPETGGDEPMAAEFRALQERMSTVVQALDEQRGEYHRMQTTLLIIVLLGVIGAVGVEVWARVITPSPPRLLSYIPVPIVLGDKVVVLGVGVVEWVVPPELIAGHAKKTSAGAPAGPAPESLKPGPTPTGTGPASPPATGPVSSPGKGPAISPSANPRSHKP